MAYKYSELQGKLQNSPFSHSEPICKHNYSNIGGAIFLIKKCFFPKVGIAHSHFQTQQFHYGGANFYFDKRDFFLVVGKAHPHFHRQLFQY
jgi:hypothetical protein